MGLFLKNTATGREAEQDKYAPVMRRQSADCAVWFLLLSYVYLSSPHTTPRHVSRNNLLPVSSQSSCAASRTSPVFDAPIPGSTHAGVFMRFISVRQSDNFCRHDNAPAATIRTPHRYSTPRAGRARHIIYFTKRPHFHILTPTSRHKHTTSREKYHKTTK